MLNNYITNQGITKTIIHDRNNDTNNTVNLVNWDMNYDGNTANLHVNNNTDGKCKSYDISMDNDGLEKMLNTQSVNMPIHKRLQNDFSLKDDVYQLKPYYRKTHKHRHKMRHRKPPMIKQMITPQMITPQTITPQMITPQMINRYIASPQENEEFIIPVNINSDTSDKYTYTPQKRHKRRRTHNTHKIYIKSKSRNSYKPRRKSRRRHRHIELL
jgi:hypothetical protein